MRFLFVTGGSPATVYALTPLATAVRNAGHDVVMAANRETMAAITGAGLPAACVAETPIRDHIAAAKARIPADLADDEDALLRCIGTAFGVMAAEYRDPLHALATAWRPDVIVGGTLTYASMVLAARLEVPHVRHSWDSGEPPEVDETAELQMRSGLAELGLPGLPATDLWLEVCPPSVRLPELPVGAPMRWIPCNTEPVLEPWMYTRTGDRPRVAVTAGTKTAPGYFFDYLVDLVGKLKGLDVEILLSAPDAVAGEIAAATGIRTGWLPFDVVARTCDLLVHHAGGGTALTGMAYGVPQLLVPNMPKLVAPSRRLADYGCAQVLMPGEDTPAAVADAAAKLLTEPRYRQRARDLADEVAAMPHPAEVVGLLEKLV